MTQTAEMTAEYTQIASEILRQINIGANTFFPVLAMLGAKDRYALCDESFINKGESIRGGVRFRTPGGTPGSRVTVELTCMDEYRVSFEVVRAGKVTSKGIHEGIGCEQIGSLIAEHYNM